MYSHLDTTTYRLTDLLNERMSERLTGKLND